MKNRKTIMVCGHYACGKTSLIQAVCKEGAVPEAAVQPMKTLLELDNILYETESVDFIDASGIKLGELAVDYWNNLQDKEQKNMPADCIWYCIDAGKTVVQPADIEILKLIGEKAIVVITRSELMTEEMVETMNSDLENIIPYQRIVITSAQKELGLNKLLEYSKDMLYGDSKNTMTEKWDKYFAHQKYWIENVRKLSELYILHGASQAFTISSKKPIPDKVNFLMSLKSNNLYMFYRIGKCYGYPVNQHMLTFFDSFIPGGEGSHLSLETDLALNSSINTAYTYAAGCAVKAYFESNMTLQAEELSKVFAAAKEKGKKINWENQPIG
jgi:ethanolamine utilization protein EutP (predicted NTPase)